MKSRLPPEMIVPKRILVSRRSGEWILARIVARRPRPTKALVELMAYRAMHPIVRQLCRWS